MNYKLALWYLKKAKSEIRVKTYFMRDTMRSAACLTVFYRYLDKLNFNCFFIFIIDTFLLF